MEAYWPNYEVTVKERGKEVPKRRSLFPGYVFARFDLDCSLPVLRLPQVVHIVGTDHPIPIPESDIEAVRILSTQQQVEIAPWNYLSVGEKVLAISGPFKGMEVFVIRQKKKQRIVVSIDMVGSRVCEGAAEWFRPIKTKANPKPKEVSPAIPLAA